MAFARRGIRQELLQLEERKSKLETELAKAPSSEPPRLHPNLAEIYRDRVRRLHEAMESGDGRPTLERVRDLIERVIVHLDDEGGAYEIELIGEIAGWLISP